MFKIVNIYNISYNKASRNAAFRKKSLISDFFLKKGLQTDSQCSKIPLVANDTTKCAASSVGRAPDS